MPKVKKLPKWAIKQAGGINKKAWALARRGKGRKMGRAKPPKAAKRPRRTPTRVAGASHGSHKPGWGRMFKTGRTVDVFTGPAQGALGNHGLTKEAGMEALRRYSANMSEGEFDTDTAKATAGGIGTGLVRDWFRSKLGIYRGLGQKKILSGVMAANPEILSYSERDVSWTTADGFNEVRSHYDRGYSPQRHNWDVNPVNSGEGERFWKSVSLDVALKVTQKVAEHFINPMLPKGYNF